MYNATKLYKDCESDEVICDLNIVTNLDSRYNHWTFPGTFYKLPEIGDYKQCRT